MGDFSQGSEVGTVTTYGAVTSGASTGTSVSDAAANVKGSWVELSSSTSEEMSSVAVVVPRTFNTGGTTKYALDIGIGAASSEVVIIPDLIFSNTQTTREPGWCWRFPITIPKGTRVAARLQSPVSGVRSVAVMLLGTTSSFARAENPYRVLAEGFTAASTSGTQVDSGGTANTKNGFAEITASTSEEYSSFLLTASHGGNSGMVDADFLLDVAIGAASSEEVIVDNLPIVSSIRECLYYPSITFNHQIPAGTRISVRTQSTITDVTDRVIEVVLYGVK